MCTTLAEGQQAGLSLDEQSAEDGPGPASLRRERILVWREGWPLAASRRRSRARFPAVPSFPPPPRQEVFAIISGRSTRRAPHSVRLLSRPMGVGEWRVPRLSTLGHRGHDPMLHALRGHASGFIYRSRDNARRWRFPDGRRRRAKNRRELL